MSVIKRRDEIRLIRILPTGLNGVVRCETSVVTLSSDPKYVALSYTWGRPPDSCVIELDGRQVKIRKNLWRFLRQISSPETEWPHHLWVDSICIDQENAAEITHQIGIMGRIFSSAERVFLWLGPSHSQSDDAIDALLGYSKKYKHQRRPEKFWNDSSATAVSRLCRRSYWGRLWILQEVILAKQITMMCGDRQVDWDTFREVLTHSSCLPQHRLERHTDYQAILASPAMSIVEQTLTTFDSSLWNLLNRNQGLRCTLQRDRVFGLLGVAKSGSIDIQPDYGVSYRRLLLSVLKNHHEEQAPATIEMVANQCQQLTDIFGLKPEDIFSLETVDGPLQLPELKFENQPGCPLGDQRISGITGWWALCYDLPSVITLLYPRTPDKDDVLKIAWDWAWQMKEEALLCCLIRSWNIDPNLPMPLSVYSNGRPSNPLLVALFSAMPTCALALIENGVTIPERTSDVKYPEVRSIFDAQLSATQCAAAHNHGEIVRILLARHMDSELREQEIGQALCSAAQHRHLETVKVLLHAGIALRKCGIALRVGSGSGGASEGAQRTRLRNMGRDMILTQAMYSRDDTLELCCFKGKALKLACGSNSPEVVAHLLSDAVTCDGHNMEHHWEQAFLFDLLCYALDHSSFEVVQVLLGRGADSNLADVRGLTLIDRAVRASTAMLKYERTPDQRNPVLEFAHLILDRHANMKASKTSLECLFLEAASEGDVTLMRTLLHRGLIKICKEQHDLTTAALNAAALGKKKEVLQLLLDHGAHPDSQSETGETPLMVVVANFGGPDIDLVQLLLHHGADTGIQKTSGWTALSCAIERGYLDTVKLLLDHGADPGGSLKLHATRSYAYADLMLLGIDSPPAEKTKEGLSRAMPWPPRLYIRNDCVRKKRKKPGQYPLKWSRQDMDTPPSETLKISKPLEHACARWEWEIVQVLLEHGADASLQKGWLTTLFGLAGEPEDSKLLPQFMSSSLDSRVKDAWLDQMLDDATRNCQWGTWRALKSAKEGALVEAPTHDPDEVAV